MSTETDLPAVVASPPRIYVAAFVLSMVSQTLWPFHIAGSGNMPMAFGGVIFAVSALFAHWAFRTMRMAGSSPNHGAHSEALTTSGPFAVSRNPIYLAMNGIYIGAAAMLNAWWPIFLLLLVLPLMHWGVILREEQYLRRRFGEAFVSYSEQVPRWL
jgi:protein-S-isoprenylcysteine O-methyltransferase Ste14